MEDENKNINANEINIQDRNSVDLVDLKSITDLSIIYVLTRKNDASSVLSKVGSSKISAQSRAQNYTDGDWVVYYEIKVPSVLQFSVEHFAHEILKGKGCWLDPKITGGSANEVFICDPVIARDAVNDSWNNIRISLAGQIGFSKSELDQQTEEIISQWVEKLSKVEDEQKINKKENDKEVSKLKTEINRLLEIRNRYDSKIDRYERKQANDFSKYSEDIEKKVKIINSLKKSKEELQDFQEFVQSEFKKIAKDVRRFEKFSGIQIDQKPRKELMDNYTRMSNFITILKSFISKKT